ncbi:MAG: hypothetical protein ABIA74_05880 [bacterium]
MLKKILFSLFFLSLFLTDTALARGGGRGGGVRHHRGVSGRRGPSRHPVSHGSHYHGHGRYHRPRCGYYGYPYYDSYYGSWPFFWGLGVEVGTEPDVVVIEKSDKDKERELKKQIESLEKEIKNYKKQLKKAKKKSEEVPEDLQKKLDELERTSKELKDLLKEQEK